MFTANFTNFTNLVHQTHPEPRLLEFEGVVLGRDDMALGAGCWAELRPVEQLEKSEGTKWTTGNLKTNRNAGFSLWFICNQEFSSKFFVSQFHVVMLSASHRYLEQGPWREYLPWSMEFEIGTIQQNFGSLNL